MIKKTISRIGEGIRLTCAEDERFKSNTFIVHFISPLTAENKEKAALIAYLLENTNSRHPDMQDFSKRMSQLYGAEITTSNGRLGDLRCTSFTATSIADRYAFDGEILSEELLSELLCCIMSPALENGVFAAENFRLKLQEMVDDISAEINDKRTYSLVRAGKTIFEGEPAGIPLKGDAKTAAALTPEAVYEEYQNMLRRSTIEIYYAAGETNGKCVDMIKDAFSKLEREPYGQLATLPSPAKAEVREVSDELDVVQCKMIMAYKFSADIQRAKTTGQLFSILFGRAPFSLLFDNVREKLSLCYYCTSAPQYSKGTVIIESGLEESNIDAARTEIARQLKAVQDGEFTDELLMMSKIYAKTLLTSIEDFPASACDWYFNQFFDSTDISPAERLQQIMDVTREDIIDFAGGLTLDTVYVLKGGKA